MPRLIDYLMIRMGANRYDAEECVHHVFEDVYIKILDEKILNEKLIFKYLINSARNQYLKVIRYDQRNVWDDDEMHNIVEPASQFDNLLDQDRQRVLRNCLDKLDEKSRDFISFFLINPDVSNQEVAKRFGISHANVRTRKSRLLHALNKCFKKNFNK